MESAALVCFARGVFVVCRVRFGVRFFARGAFARAVWLCDGEVRKSLFLITAIHDQYRR